MNQNAKEFKMGKTSKFTILELLVVIGIIAIMATMLLPVLQRAKESGYSIQCIGNLKQLGLAMESYINDSNDFYPPFFQSDVTAWTWNYSLYAGSYLKNNMTQFCPAGKKIFTNQYANPSSGDNCVKYPDRVYTYRSTHYGYNYVWFGSNKGQDYDKGLIGLSDMSSSSKIGLEPVITMKRSRVRNPSSKILIADTLNVADITRGYNVVHVIWMCDNAYLHGRHYVGANASNKAESPSYGGGTNNVYGFNGTTNFVWADGHASAIQKVTMSMMFNSRGLDKYWNPLK